MAQLAQRTERTWRFPRPMVKDQLILAGLLWLATMVIAYGIAFAVHLIWDVDVTISVWEIVSGIAPWYAAGVSGWMTFVQIPMFVANGRTRRDSFIDWGVSVASVVVWVAVLMTIGFQIERAIYALADWSLVLGEGHIFSSHSDVGTILVEYLLTYVVWGTVGGFVGAALYRFPDWGWFTIAPGMLIVVLSGSLERGENWLFGFITRRIPEFDVTSLSIAIPLALAATAIAASLAWLVVRDMPLRNK